VELMVNDVEHHPRSIRRTATRNACANKFFRATDGLSQQ
jgi:hypothetical protein